MADYYRSSSSAEEGVVETGDDFDPFGVTEYVDEHVDSTLTAPPENRWYHGRLDRNTAEDRLRVAGEAGSYLIRESDRKPGSYVLSYLGKTGFNHFRITAMCGDYYIGGRQFDALSALIGYYTSISYLLKDERLELPVSPPEPVDDRRKVKAIVPYRGMLETDELSFETNDMFIVHNELGDGWLWVTSQRTGEEGIVYEDLTEALNGSIDPVESLPYFHPNITKEEAVTKLGNAGDGSYLVRRSDNSPGNYSLFFLCSRVVKRFRIEKQGRQFYMGGRYFDTIEAVIQRYMRVQILENHKLRVPVNREVPMPMETSASSSLRGSLKDIYRTIRQTSGPTLVKCRNDRIAIKGYLNKKSQKTKKWKNMYFVLSETEQLLYYFDNEKRSKPKGLIDLSYSSLYPVHDSFFGRPNCFQLVMNAMSLNHFSVYFLCAESSDLAQEWYQTLKPYCVNFVQKKIQPNTAILKDQRSLTCQVCDARNLPCRQLQHPYCVLLLNKVKVARTQVATAQEPVWSDEFILDDIPEDIESVTVSVNNYAKRSKDCEIVSATIPIHGVESGKMADEWYTLLPNQSASRCEGASIRVKLQYLHEIIMPVEEYNGLKELLLKPDYEKVLAISSVCDNSKVFARALLRIFRHERQEANLLKVVNDMEISREDSVSQLFRTTSLATTLMDQYMKLTCTQFVHTALRGTVGKIVECKHSCEMNPDKLEGSSELETNKEQFLYFLNDAIESILQSTESCPSVLRYICGCLQESAKERWPNEESVRTRVVGGFIFLRLLCPAVINPKSFSLVTETPSEMGTRTLKLIAKSLQNLANLVEFGVKESFMKVVNSSISRNKQRIIDFLDDLSNVREYPSEREHVPIDLQYCADLLERFQIQNVREYPSERERVPIDLARDLATVHQICASNLDDLKKLSDKNEMQSLKTLLTVTEMLTNHKERYMCQT